MFSSQELSKTLFLDIETVSSAPDFESLEPEWQELWRDKARHFAKGPEETESDMYLRRAAIFAEFGKIVCISVGRLRRSENGEWTMRLHSYAGVDEHSILESFLTMLDQQFSQGKFQYLAGHNIREFDIPYISRRAIVNWLQLPDCLQIHGKKPWEVKHVLDTLELWRFGDYKHYTSLALLTTLLGIPSPKGDIDGSKVGEVYYQEHDLGRISRYCQHDVLAVAQLVLRLGGHPLISPEHAYFQPEIS